MMLRPSSYFVAFLQIGILLLACGREEEPLPTSQGLEPRLAQRPHFSISSTSQFESAWLAGSGSISPDSITYYAGFTDGTVFQIASGTTLDWTNNRRFAAAGKTFSLVGSDTTSVLKKSWSGATAFFTLSDGLEDSLTISNLKFVCNGSGFFGANYSKIEVTNVVMDLASESFTVTCNDLMIDGLNLRANSGSGLHHRSQSGQEFNHVIKNSVFRRKVGGAGPCKTSIISSPTGSVTWDNNEFFATSASDGDEFYSAQVTEVPEVDITFTNNNFRKQNILFNGLCNNATVNLLLSGNNSDIALCGDAVEVVECDACDGDFHLNITVNGWSHMGEDFGPISNQNACYVAEAESVFVEFSIGGTAVFGDSIDASVLFADDNCTTGVTEVAAWWNSETLKWNSAFDVSGITDTDCYWRGKAVLCEETITGTCIRKRFEECGGGGGVKPEWFTYP